MCFLCCTMPAMLMCYLRLWKLTRAVELREFLKKRESMEK
ncbi:hypothetical protein BVRB_6g154600 [Beta vulgaris subsp. vulgaris]|nr:hypothetical protein BVRB_6g154600 [Beta vulgaris subsp. vulgaris]